MQHRKFGNLGWEVSALGFGVMRLPHLNGDSAQIDEPEATRMIRHAIDQGVNYIDTAWPYHKLQSEIFVGKVLQDGYREKVHLATKMPSYLIKEHEDFDLYFDQQLERLQTDSIDCYLLHALNASRWELFKKLDILSWAEQKKAEGKIKHFGFSFHDKFEIFKQIIDDYDGWEFCQIQYNYMDVENQAGTKGLKYAAEKGLGIIVMEPILGGRLVVPPNPVQEIWDQAHNQRKPVDWALQWLWDQPEVSVVLSGMSSMEHVEENLESASNSQIGCLTDEDQALIDKVRVEYEKLSPIPCTGCEYCLPCPNELDIPYIFSLYNSGKMYERPDYARNVYGFMVPEGKRASDCVSCRICEDNCPQSIPIADWMVKVDEVLEQGMDYTDL